MRIDAQSREIMCATCDNVSQCLDPEREDGREDRSTPPTLSETHYCDDWMDDDGYGQDEEPEG